MTWCDTRSFDRDAVFQKNVMYLPDVVKRQVDAIDPENVWTRIDIVHSQKGAPICRLKKDGNLFQINSADPLGQAKQWVDQIAVEHMRTLFVYGCGFGYPLMELYKKLHRDSVIVVFEQDIDLFVAMLHYFDLEQIFRTRKFIFLLGDFEAFADGLQDLISTLDLAYLIAPSVIFAPNSRIFKREYKRIQSQVFERLLLQVKKLGNDHYDSMLGFHHMIENSVEVLKNPYLSALKNKFNGIPAFIIANGPSLDKHIQDLKKIEGKGLMLCCESAILPLMKNHIKPDAICVLERIPRDYQYHFENRNYPEDMSLLAFVGADPRIFGSFPGPRIPIFRLDHNNQFVNRFLGDGSGLFGGTSVAHLAYEIAVYLGANPIVLVGQDLAYGPGGLTHSKQSIYSEEKLQEIVRKIQSEPVIDVENNEGKRIPTNKLWYEFKLIYEQMIAQHPQTTVINTTESGVKIEGTIFDQLDHVIETYCKHKLPDRLDEVIRKNQEKIDLPERKRKMKTLMMELRKYIGIYQALDQLTAQSRAQCEQLMERAETEDGADLQIALQQQYERNFKQFMALMSPRLHPHFFQHVFLYGCYRINELGPVTLPGKMVEAIGIQYEVLEYFNMICQSLERNMQIDLEKLSTIETLLD